MFKYFLFTFVTLIISSCETNVVKSDDSLEDCSVIQESYYDTSVASIMSQSCNGCHAGGSPSGGIRTDNYSDVKNGISNILNRVERDINMSGFMPLSGQKLSDEKISILQAFLDMECE
tara:strand:- start:430 stop:783 length:354 start_codon:yes stop_codon:yes gene_type:complete